MKVALVHDYLVNKGGAERVVAVMHKMWRDAPIFTALYHSATTFEDFSDADVRASSLQRFSRDPLSFRRFLPFFGRAFRRMPIEGFDVTISSSAGFAHFVRPRDGCHIVYCHTPPRFLWDPRYDRTVAPSWARPLLPALLRRMRKADLAAARGAHTYVANSRFIQRRIQEIYGKRSFLIHPPIETERFRVGEAGEDYHLMVGRLLPHRNMDLTVRAFTTMGRRLIVVGEGPMRAELEKLSGPTIEFHGAVSNDDLENLYARSRGVVVAGEEDFGMVPLEANASGRPVIALGKAGALETVRDGQTGVLFKEETEDALIAAVKKAEATLFDPLALRRHAEQFGEAAFAAKLRTIVEGTVDCIECARARANG